MEYLAHRFEHTTEGLIQKDAYARQLAAQGYHVISEKTEVIQTEVANKGCLSLLSLSLVRSAGSRGETILVTYGREQLYCAWCGTPARSSQGACVSCQADLSEAGFTDWASARLIAERRQEAARRTAEIDRRADEMLGILSSSLAQDHHFDWSSLREEFPVPEPQAPVRQEPPAKPAILHLSFLLPLLDHLFPSLLQTRLAWEGATEEIQKHHKAAFTDHQKAFDEWLKARDLFEQEQTAQAEKNRRACLAKEIVTLIRYWGLVLERSQYPQGFPLIYAFDYASAEQLLTIELTLPPVTLLPDIGEVRYNPVLQTLEEIPVSQVWLQETYHELAVHLAFRIAHELFTSDVVDALSSIAFFGRMHPVESFSIKDANPVLLSLQVTKAEFNKIDLVDLNALACFKRLGGAVSENLASIFSGAP